MFLGFLREYSFYISDWIVFKAQLDNFFVVNNISDEIKRRALFLNVLDSESYKLVITLCKPAAPECTSLNSIINLLNEEFIGTPSIVTKRIHFYQLKKDEEETVEEWAAKAKNVAEFCKFGDDFDILLKKKFVSAFDDMKLWKYLDENSEISYQDLVEKVEILKRRCECNCHKKSEMDYYCSSWIGSIHPNYGFL
ncbi:uncharacterized protein [Diabrotica undecimpunctata]|uniref:uncharacterized protein n=1 Tax=Diabrotica undecimpunctata TaxID=50387 RepID=UPI003B63EFAE